MLLKLKSAVTITLMLSASVVAATSQAADTYDNKKTTTVEQTTTQTSNTAPRPVVKKSPPPQVTTTTSNTATITTKEGELHRVLDEDALKKMSDSLCVKGFKPYVGNDTKNVCQSKANVPDIAYSCIWSEDGNAAFEPTNKGPCVLEYSVHKESVIITKNDFSSNPPLPYGTEAQCCFRSAKGEPTTTVENSPTTVTVTPKTK